MWFTYIQIYQSIWVCMCLYVNDIQANMHLIQPLSENRYMQIHADMSEGRASIPGTYCALNLK